MKYLLTTKGIQLRDREYEQFENFALDKTGEKIYQFTGKYWEDRAKKNWSRLLRIFDVE